MSFILTFIDFFSGIGGFRRGMEMAGHKCIGHCEKDKYANLSYNAIHSPNESEWIWDDITTIKPGSIPKADVWCFGFPCQDISVAGSQRGLNGARSGLFYTTIELVKSQKEEDKPTLLFIENVKNLLSVNDGWDFANLLISLDEAGFDAEWQCCNSKDYGVPQNRERIFIIGHLRTRRSRKVFPVTGISTKTHTELIIPNRSQGCRVYSTNGTSCCLSANGGGQGAKTGLYLVGNINPSGKGMNGQVYSENGIAPTLTTNKGEGPKILTQNKPITRAVLTPERSNRRQNGRRMKEDGEPMFTLTTQDRHGVAIKNDFASTDDPFNPLAGYRVRKLTPKECFRLQGWQDCDYEKAAAICSDAQLYKQAGNGVTVPVIYAIAQKFNID